jgi:hypothetical protein
MSYTVRTLLITGGLLGAMLGLALLGVRLGARRIARGEEPKVRGNVVDTAVFSVLGLLLAFSFSGSMGRFDEHRRLVGSEVSAIGTLYQRIDLMPDSSQLEMRGLMHDYVQSRIDLYHASLDPNSEEAERSRLLRERLWNTAVTACKTACSPATSTLVFGGLAAMFEFPVDQAVMARLHPPTVVWGMLFGLALLCAFLVGYDHAGLKTRSSFYLLVYPLTMAAIIWVILDLEFPRLGVVRVERFDQLLISLRDTM